MFNLIRVGTAVGLWTISISLMIVRTVDRDNATLAPVTGWSVLLAIIAAVVTGWHIVIHERQRVAEIARWAATAAISDSGLRSVD